MKELLIRVGDRYNGAEQYNVAPDGCFVEIDAVKANGEYIHGGVASVVVRTEGDTTDSEVGWYVVKLLAASPNWRKTLEEIADCESLIDARTLARDALKALD